MGADMYFNPPQDDLPTQVAYLVQRNRELEIENRKLRMDLATTKELLRAFTSAIKTVRDGVCGTS